MKRGKAMSDESVTIHGSSGCPWRGPALHGMGRGKRVPAKPEGWQYAIPQGSPLGSRFTAVKQKREGGALHCKNGIDSSLCERARVYSCR
jgi:hypothetical protein